MGCDSQFDNYTIEDDLRGENARLKAKIAKLEQTETDRVRESRGYDLVNGFFVCRFERTVTDSMDAHDRVCTRPRIGQAKRVRATKPSDPL